MTHQIEVELMSFSMNKKYFIDFEILRKDNLVVVIYNLFKATRK